MFNSGTEPLHIELSYIYRTKLPTRGLFPEDTKFSARDVSAEKH